MNFTWRQLKTHPVFLFFLVTIKAIQEFYQSLLRRWWIWSLPVALVSALSYSFHAGRVPQSVMVVTMALVAALVVAIGYTDIRPSVARKNFLYFTDFLPRILLAMVPVLLMRCVSLLLVSQWWQYIALLLLKPIFSGTHGATQWDWVAFVIGSPFLGFMTLFLCELRHPIYAWWDALRLTLSPLTYVMCIVSYGLWMILMYSGKYILQTLHLRYAFGFDWYVVFIFLMSFVPMIWWTNIWIKKVHDRISRYACQK